MVGCNEVEGRTGSSIWGLECIRSRQRHRPHAGDILYFRPREVEGKSRRDRDLGSMEQDVLSDLQRLSCQNRLREESNQKKASSWEAGPAPPAAR